jgi:PAS domain S-box-containing protein
LDFENAKGAKEHLSSNNKLLYEGARKMPPEQAGRAQVYVRGIDNLTNRKRAAETIRASEKRYREFFERNLTGTFRSTPDGRLLECNDSFVRMLGYASQEEVLSHSAWDLYFQRTDRETALDYLLEKKVVTNEEFQLRRKDGSSMWILANRILNDSEHPPVIEGMIMDISRQKEAEAGIHSLLKISKTLNSTRDIDALMDSLIIEAVKMTNAECGWSGMRTPEGLACHKYFRDFRFTSFEYCWPPGSGWPGWVLAHKVPYVTNDALGDGLIEPTIREQFGIRSGIDTPILDGRGEVIGFLEVNNKKGESGFTEFDVEKMVAITQVASVALQNALAYQKIQRNEEELRQLSTRLLRLQDDERRRLARELHDSSGQILATLALKIGAARRSLGADNQKVLDSLSESAALVKQCSDDLRTLSYLLHPPLIDEEGLASALKWYAQGFAQRSGIRIELDLSPELGRLPQDVETALFRIVQEGLTNVHLHSGSPVAWIRVAHTPSEVTLEIRDEGRGIPAEVLKALPTGVSNLGVGIAGMRERVRQLGGRVEIDSGNWGTKVRAVVSLSEGLS